MNNKGKKPNIKKILTAILCVILSLCIIATTVYVSLTSDKNRNKTTSSNNTNAEIIKKNYIDGFSNFSNTKIYKFSLPQDDINEMLFNASKTLDDKYIESIYTEKDGDNYNFYVDLKNTFLVETRIKISTMQYIDNVNKEVKLFISEIYLGNVPYYKQLIEKGYLAKDFVETLKIASNIPMYFDEESFTITFKINEYLQTISMSNLENAIFNEVLSNPSNMVVTSPFSFEINFSSFASNESFDNTENDIDIYKKINDSITEEFLDEIAVGQSKIATSISTDELSCVFAKYLDTSLDGEMTSQLTNNSFRFSAKNIKINMSPDNLIFVVGINFGGLILEASINAKFINKTNDGITKFLIEKIVKFGKNTLENTNILANLLFDYLSDCFENMSKKEAYFSYQKTNGYIQFDFTNIGNEIPTIDLYNKSFEMDSINLNKFDFVLSR